MNVLIVYTSYYGSTHESVLKLASAMPKARVDYVDLRKQPTPNLKDYQIVLIGSPIHARRIDSRIKYFCLTHQTELSSRRVGLFVAAIARQERAMEYLHMNFPKWLVDLAFVKECLGGRLDLEKITFIERFGLRRFAGIKWSRNHLNPTAIERLASSANRFLS